MRAKSGTKRGLAKSVLTLKSASGKLQRAQKPLLSLMFCCLMISGCATSPSTPELHTVYQPVTVEKAVRERCQVLLPQEPGWQTLAVSAGATDLELSQAALAELEQARIYITLLKAEAKKCE